MTALSRRRFIWTGASAAASLPFIIPSHVLGEEAPSKRLTMGIIGVGGMGSGNMRAFLRRPDVQVVAVCDVDRDHATRAKQAVDKQYGNSDCRIYGDYREMLARETLDTASHALPDHWHALVSVACLKAGCDMYGEKPLARSIRGGRAICDAVHRYERVWQTGSWQRSKGDFRRNVELVLNGRIGKVSHVEVGLPRARAPRDPQPTIPVPAQLDWNMWLGPAPWREYCDFGRGVHGNWRWIMDYSGGQLTDWAGHYVDIAHWGLDFDATGPVTVEGKADYPVGKLYDVPTTFSFDCEYANGIRMTVSDQLPVGTKWIGDKGWLHVWRGGAKASDPAILRETIGPGERRVYHSDNHHGNFIDCVKERRLTITPVETAHRAISVALLGEIAMLTGRKIKWNPETETILDDPGASALLARSYREPWVI